MLVVSGRVAGAGVALTIALCGAPARGQALHAAEVSLDSTGAAVAPRDLPPLGIGFGSAGTPVGVSFRGRTLVAWIEGRTRPRVVVCEVGPHGVIRLRELAAPRAPPESLRMAAGAAEVAIAWTEQEGL